MLHDPHGSRLVLEVAIYANFWTSRLRVFTENKQVWIIVSVNGPHTFLLLIKKIRKIEKESFDSTRTWSKLLGWLEKTYVARILVAYTRLTWNFITILIGLHWRPFFIPAVGYLDISQDVSTLSRTIIMFSYGLSLIKSEYVGAN